jgi:hypothetical protein
LLAIPCLPGGVIGLAAWLAALSAVAVAIIGVAGSYAVTRFGQRSRSAEADRKERADRARADASDLAEFRSVSACWLEELAAELEKLREGRPETADGFNHAIRECRDRLDALSRESELLRVARTAPAMTVLEMIAAAVGPPPGPGPDAALAERAARTVGALRALTAAVRYEVSGEAPRKGRDERIADLAAALGGVRAIRDACMDQIVALLAEQRGRPEHGQ